MAPLRLAASGGKVNEWARQLEAAHRQAVEQDVDRLEARLAQATELLREAQTWLPLSTLDGDEFYARIGAFLKDAHE